MPVSRPLAKRFHEKYAIDLATGCWNWTACLTRDGYGSIAMGAPSRKTALAHRVSYELLIGPIPEGLVIDHLCRNRACVNPAHLEVVPFAVNVLRGEGACAQHARRSTCGYGHPYDATRRDGKRRCLRCAADASARYRARKHAADA
jgi:hypothetical protein